MATELQSIAEDKLEAAKMGITLRYEFFAVLLFQLKFKIRPAEWVKARSGYATAFTDGVSIYFAREFLEKISVKVIMFVIAHEIYHVAFHHIWRRLGRDAKRWNVAIDLVANILLKDAGFTLWEDALVDESVRGLTAEQVFDLLPDDDSEIPEPMDGISETPQEDSDDGDENENDEQNDENTSENNSDSNNDESHKKEDETSNNDDSDGQGDEGEEDVDDEEGNGNNDSENKNEQGKNKGKGKKKKNDEYSCEPDEEQPSQLSPQEKVEELMKEWQEHLAAAEQIAEQRGTMPGNISQQINEIVRPQLPWNTILARHVSTLSPNDYSYSGGTDRRYSNSGFCIPQLSEQSADAIIYFDTSGSIFYQQELLKRWAGEVTGMLRSRNINSIRFMAGDTRVTLDETIRRTGKLPTHYPGGGGTNFKPVFGQLRKERAKPDIMIFFTDCYGSWPDKKPAFPVMFIVYGCGEPPKWGTRVQYTEAMPY